MTRIIYLLSPDIKKKETKVGIICNFCTVKIKNLDTDQLFEYTLVSETEANLSEGKISASSPIGKGLLSKKKGDTVEIQIPTGILKFEIIDISR